MKLDENYTINSNEFQWTLNYEFKKWSDEKNKIITTKDQYYYPNLKSAIKGYIDKKLKKAETVEETILELNKLLQLL